MPAAYGAITVNRLSLLALIFLRLYAGNLERSRRAAPETAHSDALAQTSMFVGSFVLGAFFVVAAVAWPRSLYYLAHRDPRYFLVAFTCTALVIYPVIKRCKQYHFSPAVIDVYRSAKNRWLTQVLFVLIPLLWILAVGFGLRGLKPYL
jgi:hypothetical protein